MPGRAPHAPAPQPGAIPRDRRLPLAVLCAATLMTIVDETVVSVALPTIQRELGFATGGLSWIVNAYLIAFGGLLLLAGRVGDLVGRRRVLLAGLGLFVAASALCAAATSPAWLVVARFLQGAGGALAAAVALGMVAALFPDPAQRARAFAVYAFVGASGASIGLFAGGIITDLAGWRWIFLINLPIGLATIVAGRRTLAREAGPGLAAGADAPGATLLVAGLMLLIGAIVGGGDAGPWLGAAGIALLVGFVARQATASRPLVPAAAVRSGPLVAANVAQALLVGAMFGFQFLIALYFQRVLGYRPAQAGLAVLPVAVGIGATSLLVFPRLVARAGPRGVLVPALAALAAGLALLTRAPVDGRYLVDVVPSVVLFAAGGGLALPALMTLAMAAASERDAGLASGLLTTSQQVGGALGLAVLAALATGRTGDLVAAGSSRAEALVGGFHLAWTVGAGLLVAAVAVVALLSAPSPRDRRRRAPSAPVRPPAPEGCRAR